jgi:TolB protein
MPETSENQPALDESKDQVIVRHPDGKSEKFTAPETPDNILRIGRELDNDIILIDPRASRHHAELRRASDGELLEIKDLNSANGVVLGTTRIKPDSWEKVVAGQVVQFGETRLYWEQAAASQSTIAMTPLQRQQAAERTAPAAPVTAAAAAAGQAQEKAPYLSWFVIGAAVILLLLLIGIGSYFFFRSDSGQTAQSGSGQAGQSTPVSPAEAATTPTQRAEGPNLSQQTPGSVPTPTPTPSGPQIPIPVVEIISSEVRPIILGALPSTDKALFLVKVRVRNIGNASFLISTADFSLKTSAGQVFAEAGGTTSPQGLRRLGVVDRFDNLALTPGGSVPESLLFDLSPDRYDLELVFKSPDAEPIVLGLGTVNVGSELALALGTPVVEATPSALAVTETPTPEPSPTPTRPPAIPAPKVVSRSALVGTIAYPVFNGRDYDLYFGAVDGSGSQFYRGSASQPAFSLDGSRIAFHSWSNQSRGLVTMDINGANAHLVTNFVEDQLPVWTTDGQDIIFLTRRSGRRQSEIMRANGSTELAEAIVLGEGEYPTVSASGQLVFKGWGQTAFGLRLASSDFEGIDTVTNVEEDTAPALSPNGEQVVFMSRREGNWDIYLINVDGSNLQRLSSDEAEDGLPVWSPDGNAIAFVSNRGGPWAVWVMTPDGSGKSQVFTMEGSPDGMVGTDTYASRGWAEERISWTAADLVE